MALTPIDEVHALQIQAGTLGRKSGHDFEDEITKEINNLKYPYSFNDFIDKHVFIGNPAIALLEYACSVLGRQGIHSAIALSTGALATSEEGQKWLMLNGVKLKRCKSDLILTLKMTDDSVRTLGVSTKQCSNQKPTNAQLYFTTARGFAALLRNNGLSVSENAVLALRQFCGDIGFRPLDDKGKYVDRKIDPRRFFWEEIDPDGRHEWEALFARYQNGITKLLLQKAYLDDPYSPDLLLHKTKKSSSWSETEIALYSIRELIFHSANYGGFSVRPYSVRKGSYRDPVGIIHYAPRFGIVQMQRGGQAQHPEQLQFNLEAGYFYKLQQLRPDMPSDDERE